MNQRHTKNKLYLLPALLFCLNLQGTETTQSVNEAVQPKNEVFTDLDNNQTESTDLDLMRKQQYQHNKPHHKPKYDNNMPQYTDNNMSPYTNDNTYSMNSNSAYMNNNQHYNNGNQYYNNGTIQQNTSGWQNNSISNNSAGSFDASFRTNGANATIGYVINTMGHKSEPRAVTVQKDNKIVVAGIRDDYPLLVRYTNNGELDKDFGGFGTYGPGVTIQTSLGKNSWFNAVAIDPQCDCNQKIIAAGSFGGSASRCTLARYYHDGTLDTAFGDKGIIKTGIPGELNAIAIQKDGLIVVAGYATYDVSNTQILLLRYNNDGTPDTNFGKTGVVITPAGNLARANAIAIQENNKIVAVGTVRTGNQNNMVIARYNENGTPDTNFGQNGVIILNQIGINNGIAYDIAIQKDGGIIIAGSSLFQNKNFFTIIRLQQNGTVDTTFGIYNDGIVTINPTPTRDPNADVYARSVALDKNGNIVVMGSAMTSHYSALSLVRLNPNGRLDLTFGNHVGIQFNILNFENLPNKVNIPVVVGTIQNDKEKLVLVSMYSNKALNTANQMAVARYLN